jgi:hypothetical protein
LASALSYLFSNCSVAHIASLAFGMAQGSANLVYPDQFIKFIVMTISGITVPPEVEILNYSRVGTFSRIFPKLVFFGDSSLYIIIIAGSNSQAAMGGSGARSALFCVLTSLKRRKRAMNGRARGENTTSTENTSYQK